MFARRLIIAERRGSYKAGKLGSYKAGRREAGKLGHVNGDAKYGIHDTPPHIQKILIATYRIMTPQQKFQQVSELTSALTKSTVFGRLGRAPSIMLGFVPLPNLRKSSICQEMISKGETQQI